MKWDADIAELDLSETEKNGLQVYRNYTRSFADHAEKKFLEDISRESFDIDSLRRVLDLISQEDGRFLPLIACAYADQLLEGMFKRQIPKGVPGGTQALFGPYGPLSNLAGRIRMAFAFDMMSADVLVDLDKVRKARNSLSHDWDLATLSNFFSKEPIVGLTQIERELFEHCTDLFSAAKESLDPLAALRIRLIWIIARVSYETAYYARARRQGLNAARTLYGNNVSDKLRDISDVAMGTCSRIVAV